MKQNSRKILPSFITPSSPGLKRFKQGGHMPDKAPQAPSMDTGIEQVLPSFITPVSPGLQKFVDGGELGGVEQEGIEKEGGGMSKNMAAGMGATGSVVGAVVPAFVDNTWAEDKHGTNVERETGKGFWEGTGQGAALGTSIMPGWGTLIGAAAGGIAGAAKSFTSSRKSNKEYNSQFKDNYSNVQSQELEPLFARDGGMLYGDGGSLDGDPVTKEEASKAGQTLNSLDLMKREQQIEFYNRVKRQGREKEEERIQKSMREFERDAAARKVADSSPGMSAQENKGPNVQRTAIELKQGGMLYDDGGQLPKLAKNGDLPDTYNEYNGNPHELGGIPVGPNAEVEDGEVRWGDYIYSDSLMPDKNFTV